MRNFIINHALKTRDFILDILFPIECLGCGQEGEYLCSKCFKKLAYKENQACFVCKKPNQLGQTCRACRKNTVLDGLWAGGDYENKLLAGLLKNYKYKFNQKTGLILAKYLVYFFKNHLLTSQISLSNNNQGLVKTRPESQILLNISSSLLVPVPLHKKRLRFRGFNQSLELAQAVSAGFGLKLNSTDLIRIKHKKPQAKLSGQKRIDNIKNCFAWEGKNLSDKNIILVDDVATTGSTLEECAKILKINGAKEVWALVVAKG